MRNFGLLKGEVVTAAQGNGLGLASGRLCNFARVGFSIEASCSAKSHQTHVRDESRRSLE